MTSTHSPSASFRLSPKYENNAGCFLVKKTLAICKSLFDYFGDPNRDTSRTGRDMPNRHVEALIEAARSEQMAKMWALLNSTEDDDELLLAA